MTARDRSLSDQLDTVQAALDAFAGLPADLQYTLRQHAEYWRNLKRRLEQAREQGQ